MEENFGKSDFFDLQENVAAALILVVPVVLTFIPGIKYFAWVIPLVVLFIEKKSLLVRLCASVSMVAALMITIMMLLVLLAGGVLTAYFGGSIIQAIAAQDWQNGLHILLGSALWLILWIISFMIRIGYAVTMIMAAVQAFKGAILHIPLVTSLAKKLIKYYD